MTNSIVLLDWESIMKQTYPMVLEVFKDIYSANQEFYSGLVVIIISGAIVKKFRNTSIDVVFGKILGLPKRGIKIIKNLFDLHDCMESLNSKLAKK